MTLLRAAALLAIAWLARVIVSSLFAAVPFSSLRLCAPDVLLLVAIYVGLSAQGALSWTCALCLVLGYLGDLMSGTPKGLLMTAYPVAGVVARSFSSRLLVRGGAATAIVVLLFAAFVQSFVVVLRVSLAPALGLGALGWVPIAAASTALASLPLFPLLRGCDARLRARRRSTLDPVSLIPPGGAA